MIVADERTTAIGFNVRKRVLDVAAVIFSDKSADPIHAVDIARRRAIFNRAGVMSRYCTDASPDVEIYIIQVDVLNRAVVFTE